MTFGVSMTNAAFSPLTSVPSISPALMLNASAALQ
jgi:hypothetical protein